jgi:ComEC/Rec2-related protein
MESKSALSPFPAARFFLLLAAGLAIQSLAKIPALWLLFAMALLLPFFRLQAVGKLILFALLILSGMLRWAIWEENLPPADPLTFPQETALLITNRHENSFYIKHYTAEIKTPQQKIRLLLYPDAATTILEPGRIYFLKDFEIFPVESAKNPYQFDYRRYLYHKGITHQLKLDESQIPRAGKVAAPILHLGQKSRYLIADRLNQVFGYEYGEFLSGLLLGLKERIDPERRNEFSSLGLSHLLAVSGLHVGFIVMLLLFAGDLLHLNRFSRPIVLIAVLLFFAVITGLSASVLRASLMTAIFLLAPLFYRRSNALNSLMATGFLLLLWKPAQLYDVGFQFSFTAVWGILTLYPRIKSIFLNRLPRFPINYFTDLLLVSAAASLVTAPLTIYYFQTVPLLSIFLNLVFIPLAFLIIALLLLTMPFLWLPIFPGFFFGGALELSVKLFHELVFLANRFDGWILPVTRNVNFILLLTIFFILLLISHSPKIRLSAAALAILIYFAAIFWQRQPEIIVFSSRGAPMALIASQNQALLINTGLYSPFQDHYIHLIQPVLQKLEIRRLLIALSEAHRRNGQNLEILLENEPVLALAAPHQWQKTEGDAPYTTAADTTLGKWHLAFQYSQEELHLKAELAGLRFSNDFYPISKKNRREIFTLEEAEKSITIANVKLPRKNRYHHLFEKGAIHRKYFLGRWLALSKY